MHPVDAHVNGVRWEGEFTVETQGRWEWTIEAWSDMFGTWRDELQRKHAAGQDDLAGELSEGVVMLEDAAARATEGDDRATIERALDALKAGAGVEAALAPDLLEAVERAAERHGAARLPQSLAIEVDRVRARFSSWYELFPRSWGGLKAVEAHVPAIADLGFDVLYLPPIHPIGRKNRKGRNNALTAGPDDPGSPYAIGAAEGGHDAVHPELGTLDDVRALCATARRARDGRRARHRAQRLRRPPVADRAPGVVPPPPGRHDQVRREPAQEVPGHLQLQLGHAGLEGAVGRVAADHAGVGRGRREGVPDRQPAHQAVPVLGVADPGGPRGRPRRDLPRRGVHPPRRDARAGQARLRAVLHVLHVEELALGADRVRQRARVGPGERVLPAELLRQHAGHPARLPPARRAAGVRRPARAGRHAEPELRDLLRLRALRERAGPRGHRGVPGLGEVRGPRARARRPAAADDPARQRDPAREPGAAGALQRPLPRDPQRRADRVCQALARQLHHHGRQPRSAPRARGRRGDPGPARPAAGVRGRGPADRRSLRLADRRELRPARPGRLPGPHLAESIT